jgi:hypothetical protein
MAVIAAVINSNDHTTNRQIDMTVRSARAVTSFEAVCQTWLLKED